MCRLRHVKRVSGQEPTSFNSNYHVLAWVNSAASPAGLIIISTRPQSATLLPVSTASTGLLHLLVGAQVHRVRSDTGNQHMWLQPHMYHSQCLTYTSLCSTLAVASTSA